MTDDHWKVELTREASFVTKSDEWLALVLGSNLQIGTLRLFAYAVAFAAVGATLTRSQAVMPP
jgi:hypothetical protein